MRVVGFATGLLTPHSNHFQVFAFDPGRAVSCTIIPGPVFFEVASQRGLAAFIKGGKRFLCRTKVLSEMLNNFRRRKWIGERYHSRPCL